MTTKTKNPGPDILPPHLVEPPAVAEAARRVAEAVAVRDAAQRARREARAAVEAAPAVDKAALRAAVEAGRPDPQPTEPARKAEADAAQRRVDAANELVTEASARFRAVLVAHREALNRTQAPRVDEAAVAVAATLDTLASQLDTLASEAGAWRGLYRVIARRELTPADERSRAAGRVPTGDVPGFEPAGSAGPEHVASLRAIVEELRMQPTPAPDRRAERNREREAKAERERVQQEEQEQRVEGRKQRAAA